jgi:pterin-4a-carbinolamine dehydratase/Zn-dependent peptidase ImmA (M78 family)
MLTLELFEELEGPPEPTLIDALRDFLPIAVKHLKIKELPKIKLLGDVETDHMPSFGKFSNDDRTVHLGIKNRHPNDILRTLAHEMVHYAQGQRDELGADSWQTGSPVEDQANAEAGVIMREFNKQFPQYMELKPIMLEKWSKKYKKSINCSNPKGFSQKAHCAGRKKNTNEAEDSCPPATQDITLNLKNRQKAIDEYGYGPLNPDLPNTKFWMKKVDEWNLDSAEEAKSSLCGNCAAFDLRKDTLDCIAQGIDSESPEDAQGTIDAGDLGYCKFLKFKCASRRTCDAWVTGGPLVDPVNENLRDWFKKDKWVRMDTKGKIKGPCAREPGEGKPKCLPQAKAHALGKKGRAAAAQKKRREDPDPNRRGPAKNVATKVREESTRRDPKDLTAPTDQELDKLHHKFIPTWSMLDHDLLATAYDFQDDDTALSYVNQLDDVEQSMDHNAVITIDNARVSIKVRTGDIDGLSRLDFEFALRANDLAHKFKANQLPHATNAINEQQFDENCWKGYHKEGMKKMFGKTVPNCVKNESKESCPECGGAMYPESMLNEKQDACYYKVKSRYKVWPSAYASGALVQCRKKGAANWGNKSAKESIEENFADGKGPGRAGDSQRHGIPKGATIAQLEKAAKAPGRKGQLARWQINMRRGKKK